ncbi:hydrolase [Acinetobacter nectaris]|uniref:hydrolase n=1 Tax=Acinetobacter nectaris TaxID=1219382 RepID=UPI001F36E0CE|nr:hydrolase [Acinetobacter nectaris]MCF8998860.1 hydrolase [Acinetobacter nectaris]MCF9027899.1 hydrolase [Acinetobacter nectaris]
MKTALIISGWGVSKNLLDPLAAQFKEIGYQATVIDIFDPFSEDAFKKIYALAFMSDVVIGWSLGGQLATCLALEIFEKQNIRKPVICLASNPSFVRRENWQYAMPLNDFESFRNGYDANEKATLKQFYLNICRGEEQLKQNWQFILKHVDTLPIDQLKMGLGLLESLNLVDNLKDSSLDIHYIFGEGDALVPCQVIRDIGKLSAKSITTIVLPKVSHAFPIFHVQETLQAIQKFLCPLE